MGAVGTWEPQGCSGPGGLLAFQPQVPQSSQIADNCEIRMLMPGSDIIASWAKSSVPHTQVKESGSAVVVRCMWYRVCVCLCDMVCVGGECVWEWCGVCVYMYSVCVSVWYGVHMCVVSTWCVCEMCSMLYDVCECVLCMVWGVCVIHHVVCVYACVVCVSVC